jgi:hypothetical protein
MENVDTKNWSTNIVQDFNKKQVRELRTRKGFKLIFLGAMTLFLGCITNLVLPMSSSFYHPILYGITTTGACIVLFGLYLVME